MLQAIQESTGALYAKSPLLAISIFAVLFLAITILAFQSFFLTPARKTQDAAPTSQNIQGIHVGQLNIYVSGAPPAAAPAPAIAVVTPLVDNGGFEDGIVGWGTGWFESHFQTSGATLFNHAQARWYVDDKKALTGKRALRVEHASQNAPHVFSSFSQRIKVAPARRYEVTFSVYLEAIDPKGAFALRVLPSRASELGDWDRFKSKADYRLAGKWQTCRVQFDSGNDAFWDLRFAAETSLNAWIDDVSVAESK